MTTPEDFGVPAEVELVVHGPLTAMLLAGSVSRHTGREPEEFSFRALAPLFAGFGCTLTGEPKGPEVELTAVRNDGRAAMRATARVSLPPARVDAERSPRYGVVDHLVGGPRCASDPSRPFHELMPGCPVTA